MKKLITIISIATASIACGQFVPTGRESREQQQQIYNTQAIYRENARLRQERNELEDEIEHYYQPKKRIPIVTYDKDAYDRAEQAYDRAYDRAYKQACEEARERTRKALAPR